MQAVIASEFPQKIIMFHGKTEKDKKSASRSAVLIARICEALAIFSNLYHQK